MDSLKTYIRLPNFSYEAVNGFVISIDTQRTQIDIFGFVIDTDTQRAPKDNDFKETGETVYTGNMKQSVDIDSTQTNTLTIGRNIAYSVQREVDNVAVLVETRFMALYWWQGTTFLCFELKLKLSQLTRHKDVALSVQLFTRTIDSSVMVQKRHTKY